MNQTAPSDAHDDVVGAVEALALVAVGDHRDRAVVLGALDAPGAVRAAHEPALAVDRVAVGVARRRAEDADVAGGLVPAQHPVVGDVAPDQVAPGREVGRPLGPAAALEQLLDARARAHEAPEALVEDLVLVRSQGCGPPQTSSRKTISVASRATRAELEDAGVAARALRVARGDLLEQLVHGELVLAQRAERLAAGVQVAALGQRDQLLELGLDRLGLGLGGLDALVLDDLLAEVRQQRLAVRGAAAELVAGLLVAHRGGS